MTTLNRLLIVLVVFLIFVFVFSFTVEAQELAIPDDYDTLLARYKDMADIAMQYKGLYEEAESDLLRYKELYEQAEMDNRRLLQSNQKLQGLIDTQSEIINELLNKKNIGIITGVNIVPANLGKSGVIVGFDFRF